ncbi:MAG: hypothetical protein Q7S96_03390 [bacterium]|nr:hypothetical protein [bacterium]
MGEDVSLFRERGTGRFIEFLTFLFDGTGLFMRKEWATFLDVSEDQITIWLRDVVSPPGPTTMCSIMRVLHESTGITGVVERFAEIERLPLWDISTKNREQWSGTRSLSEYLCLPLMDGLFRSMADLTIEQRQRVIQDATETAHKIRT